MKIIIVYIKEDEKLERCLKSLKEFSPKIEVILKKADPSKTQICEEVLADYFNSPEFTEDTMIWHPDMMATLGWYEELMKYYDFFDVIGMKILYPNGIVNHYGGAIRADGVGFHPHQFSYNIGLTKPLDTAFVTGPGMVVKRKVWGKVQYDFQFQHYIDVDFCFQARNEGFSVGVVPVEVYHWEGLDGFKNRDPQVQAQMLKDYHDKFVAKWMTKL